jgi:hypothetical protein
MGKTKVTTLSSGEQVHHYPPDEDHPDGRMVLIPHDSIGDRIMEIRADNRNALSDLHVAHHAQVREKNDAEAAHPAVPPEKRFV